MIQKTKRTSSPLSPVTLSHAGRKSVKTFDEGLNDDDDDDDEILEFERRIRSALSTCMISAFLLNSKIFVMINFDSLVHLLY